MFHGLFALVHAHLAQEVGGLSLCLHPAPSFGASSQSPQKIKKMYFARLVLSLDALDALYALDALHAPEDGSLEDGRRGGTS